MKAFNSTAIPTAPALTVRVARPHEVVALDAQLADHHYLGAGRPVGDYFRQLVERDGQALVLLVWGPSCYALKDRDLWISWSACQRVARLKLVLQNRRFLLLTAKGQSPNLASQSMGAALRALPGQWREHFGYRPLLAESFTDPEAYAGTCYKASNWEPVGASADYSRHRADFYLANDRPKKLWLRELSPGTRAHLRAAQVPEECRTGLVAPPSGVLPVTAPQMKPSWTSCARRPIRAIPTRNTAPAPCSRSSPWRCWRGGATSPKSRASPPRSPSRNSDQFDFVVSYIRKLKMHCGKQTAQAADRIPFTHSSLLAEGGCQYSAVAELGKVENQALERQRPSVFLDKMPAA